MVARLSLKQLVEVRALLGQLVCFKQPIFTIDTYYLRYWKVTWNDLLNQFEFYRVFGPYQAFQELEMYLNNLARPMKPMPVIPDELKIQTHGFNKYSFRKVRF